jgi:hypothetical protein
MKETSSNKISSKHPKTLKTNLKDKHLANESIKTVKPH